MSDDAPDPSAPWVRLAGAILLGFLVAELAIDISFATLFEHVQAADRAESFIDFERRDRAYRLLDLTSTASLCAVLFVGWCMAAVLAGIARSAPRLRPLAALGALAFVGSTVYWLGFLVLGFAGGPNEAQLASLDSWRHAAELALLVAWGSTAALVLLRTRGGPRFTPALVGAGVALAASLTHLFVSPLVSGEHPPSWWTEPVLGLSGASWVHATGAVGLGLGLWVAADPTRDVPDRRFDAAAARALRLARTVVWWRLGIAVGVVVLTIAATAAARKAQQHAMFGTGSGGSSDFSWMLELAPWLGMLELALAVLMIVALGTVVLQRRSRLATALVGVGTVLLLLVTLVSYSLDVRLYEALLGNFPGFGWGGGDVREYVELAAEMQPTLRWLGLLGMGTTLAGLVVLVRTIGRGSPKRAIRMLVIATSFTAAWLHGREVLGELGMTLLLLAPLILGAAVWMLLDLVTFLREVADGLDPEPPASGAPTS
jgi:hypothetical protein